jgi:hypothetical protein
VGTALVVFCRAALADWDFYPGDYSEHDVIGQSLPATWRPFSDDSPWNSKIGASPPIHPDSGAVLLTILGEATNIRFSNSFVPPIWVVNSDNMPQLFARSTRIFDTWDQDEDERSDARIPIDSTMYPEPTVDGHIIIVDPFHLLSWEMSRYTGISGGTAHCTTFNIWDLKGSGTGETTEGSRWFTRGGRGSGFPIIAGLLRPEEVVSGVIDHALVFATNLVRTTMFVPPATRSDGTKFGNQHPMEGMLFQLDPGLDDADFDSWGLGTHAKVVARALQEYGMYLGDSGGAMSIQVQLLDSDPAMHRIAWDLMAPDLYDDVKKIPVDAFRVIDTGPAIMIGGGETTTVAPLILPVAGPTGLGVSMASPTPGAQIRYTTDGSEPLTSSTPYVQPFQPMGPAVEIRARAFSTLAPSPITRAPSIVHVNTVPAFPPPWLAWLFLAMLVGTAAVLRGRAWSRR